MRRTHPAPALAALAAALALMGAGAPRKKPLAPPLKPLKADEAIGDIAEVISASEVQVEGVGLVIGLDGTGSNPEPGYYRTKLVDQMRKAGVENADKYLDSKNTSLVIVRARIRAGTTRQDRIDAEVELTPNSETKSLAGGVLLSARLTEVRIIKDAPHEGKVLAVAGGPVLVGNAARPDDPKVGRVLGGCRVKLDMPYVLVVDKNHQSVRTTTRLQSVITQRFHQHEGLDEKGMAEAKNESYLTLKVPKVYHQNQARYFQVVKLMPVVDNPQLRAQRLERWSKELLDPKTAGVSALRLEGLGRPAVEPLKKGLASDHDQVKFFSAEALAYLDDTSGCDVLARAAVERKPFRAFALAALAASDQAGAALRLRSLMNEPDVEVRYGAFNALRTLDENDAFLGRVAVFEPEPGPEEDESPLEMRIATARRRRERPTDPFALYVVDCEGPPLVHVSRSRRAEIVVFGRSQKLLAPVVLGHGGPILLNASDGDATVQISRIVSGKGDDGERRVSCKPELGEVIRETAQLGASYPEVVAILTAAYGQKNLPGALAFDAVPLPDKKYDEALLLGIDATSKADAAVKKAAAEEPRRRGLLDRIFRR